MQHLLLTLFLLIVIFEVIAQTPQEKSELHVRAEAPVVSISTREAGENFMTLPSLNFNLMIDQQCVAGYSPIALSLSVADTRRSFNADALSQTDSLKVELTIPEQQIGPITVEQFCIASNTEVDVREIHAPEDNPRRDDLIQIPALLSLQASLTCSNELESRVVYASAPLDVSLQCEKTAINSPAGQ